MIGDGEKAHLFFTSLNGKLWRAGKSYGAIPWRLGFLSPQAVRPVPEGRPVD